LRILIQNSVRSDRAASFVHLLKEERSLGIYSDISNKVVLDTDPPKVKNLFAFSEQLPFLNSWFLAGTTDIVVVDTTAAG
jgi:hypothetical protein